MAKQHQTTLRSKTFSVGKLANVLHGENWDVEYFVDNSTKMSFKKMTHDIYEPNLKAQITIQHVVCTLMGIPHNWITLENVI
jgi:diaminopimelate epimerase